MVRWLFFLISTSIFCQINTEIHVFDIEFKNNEYQLLNGINISNNEGYDNQPSFYDANKVLFAHQKGAFTEIALFDLASKSIEMISNTSNGGEYSPQKMPYSESISAVRLDDNGLQRFYQYNRYNQTSTELIPDLKVAYPTWFDDKTIVASVIVNDGLELFVCNVKSKKYTSVAKMVGRSVHKIPNTNLISFISKENKEYNLLKSLDVATNEIKTITSIGKAEDVAWMPNGWLLIPNGKRILKFNPSKDVSPTLFYNFLDEDINNISRMAVNSTGTKIALVAEVSPVYLAQQQLDGYNKRDIEAFLKPYASDVKVYNFPNNLRYEGLDKMRTNYTSFFAETPDLHCELLHRIVHENTIIDHELVTVNGKKFKAVAIYTIKNGKIDTVTFL